MRLGRVEALVLVGGEVTAAALRNDELGSGHGCADEGKEEVREVHVWLL